MKKILIFLINVYKKIISPIFEYLGVHCKYYPTCSQYMKQAIEKYGVTKGLFLGIIGSVIPIIITIYGYITIYNYFGGKILSSSLAKLIEPYPFVYLTSLLLLGIGMLVGMFGSWRAVRKYLKI